MAGPLRTLGLGKTSRPGETSARAAAADTGSHERGVNAIRPFKAHDSDGDIDLVALTEPDELGSSGELAANTSQENAELRQHVAKLEALLSEALDKSKYWEDQHSEYVGLLEEKSEVIREMHLKLESLQTSHAAPAPPVLATPGEADLLSLCEELEKERAQLKEDEAALMEQMRALEVQMSRERADLGRQRAEIQRLHNEVKHELDLANREAALRDRLQPLMRRQQDLLRSGSSEPPAARSTKPVANEAAPSPPPTTSGIFRRLFSS
jgi:hypothetical protein